MHSVRRELSSANAKNEDLEVRINRCKDIWSQEKDVETKRYTKLLR